jgi:hypothetical protein
MEPGMPIRRVDALTEPLTKVVSDCVVVSGGVGWPLWERLHSGSPNAAVQTNAAIQTGDSEQHSSAALGAPEPRTDQQPVRCQARRQRPRWTTAVAILVMVLLCYDGPASAGCSVEAVQGPVGQRGTVFTIRLEGAGLSDAPEILWYREGLISRCLTAESDNLLVAEVEAAANCPLGTHPFRVRSASGISELRILRITPFPVVTMTDSEDPGAAQLITGLTTFLGTISDGAGGRFRVRLNQGEPFAAEVEGVRLGAGLTDTRLTLSRADGQQLMQVDDTPLLAQDPFLSFVAPEEGEYLLTVSLSGGGNDTGQYALHAGSYPRPKLVYPAGGRAGEQLSVQLLGDASGDWSQEITVSPSDQAVKGFGWVFAAREGVTGPTALPFRVSDCDQLLEQEPNDDLVASGPSESSSLAHELPYAFNGFLSQPGDVDQFRFSASGQSEVDWEAFSTRIGSSADVIITILSTTGEELARNDDGVGLDSRLHWICPEDGEYLLQVSDKRADGGPDAIYRVEATVVEPRLTAFLPRRDRLSQAGQAVSVPQGNRSLVLMGVQRLGLPHGALATERSAPNAKTEGDASPASSAPESSRHSVSFAFDALPTGVSLTETQVTADQFVTPLVFEAAPDAMLSGRLSTVRAYQQGPMGTITGGFEQIVDLVSSSADRLYQATTVDRLAVAVTQAAPYRVTLKPLETFLPRDGALAIEVEVERSAEFRQALDITFPMLPPWVTGPEKLTIPPDAASGIYLLTADPEAELREWPLVAEAKPGLGVARDEDSAAAPGVPSFRRGARRTRSLADQVVASQLMTLPVAESPLRGTIGEQMAEAGGELILEIPVERTGPTPETLTATLEGLPNRVQASPVTISPEDTSVRFRVQLDATAPLGLFTGLQCRLTGAIRGQQVSYVIGRGGRLRIVVPGELVLDESGRPLSPLELLRRSQSKTSLKPVIEEPAGR